MHFKFFSPEDQLVYYVATGINKLFIMYHLYFYLFAD